MGNLRLSLGLSDLKSRTRFGFLVMFKTFITELITPASSSRDELRRGRILCILLLAMVSLSLVAAAVTTVGMAQRGASFTGAPPAFCVLAGLFFGSLYFWTKRSYSPAAALMFIGFFTIIATYTMVRWGVRLPQGLLLYALIIGMSGILLGTQTAGVMTALVIGLLVFLTIGEAGSLIRPDATWQVQMPSALDAIGYAVTLGVLALVSWMSTREAERSLARARRSESELRDERDSLELKVAQRSRELEQEQAARAMELHRFTEFGRVSAGFLHDITNPLTATILHLDQLGARDQLHSKALEQARQSIRYVERYVEAARKQLQARSEAREFDVEAELRLVISMLEHRARAYGVKIELLPVGDLKLFGDPVRFNQLAANLLTNALEAYDGLGDADPLTRRVRIRVTGEPDTLVIRVRDWGKGLPGANQDIFAPFFSTKVAGGRAAGLGLGLTIVKRIVEDDFRGSVGVTGFGSRGTEFELRLGAWRG